MNFASEIWNKPAAAAAADDVVTKSLRFEKSSTANLNGLNPSGASSRKTTISTWIKLVETPSSQTGLILLNGTGGGLSDSALALRHETSGKLSLHTNVNNAGVYTATTTRVFRDFSSWYHIVIAWDTDQADEDNRLKFYVNNEQETLTGSFPARYYDDRFGVSGGIIRYGALHGYTGGGAIAHQPSSSYMADIIRIDGQQLTPSSFAEEDGTTGQWKPIDTSGLDFGTAGFHLPFTDSSTSDSFTDSSTSTHTITANGDAEHTVAQKKVGDSSIYFDGSGDYLSIPASTDFDFGTGDFTIEMWIRPNDSGTNTFAQMFELYDSSSDRMYLRIERQSANVYRLSCEPSGGSSTITSSNSAPNYGNWEHLAVVRSSGTITMYVDGVAQTDTDTNTSTLDFSSALRIGSGLIGSGSDLSGYLDEYRISDTARYTSGFTPSTTAFVSDSNTMLLIHSNYAGGIGADTSGEGNNFTATNLAASDVVNDRPTSNFCVLNALDHSGGTTLTEGNLEYDTSGWNEIRGTMGVSSGKWYYEVYVDNFNASSEAFSVGIAEVDGAIQSTYWSDSWDNSVNGRRYGVNLNGTTVSKIEGGSATTISATIVSGDVISILLDLDSGTTTLKFWVNGANEQTLYSSLAAGTYAIGFNSYTASLILNVGQDPTFAGNDPVGSPATSEFAYTPTSGYKAWSTANLPTPTIAKPAEYFDTDLWSGTGAATRNIATPFDPVFVWIKCRSHSGNGADHTLWDSLRGVSSSVNTGLSSSHPEPEGFNNDITTTANFGGVSVLGTELYTLKEGASNARYVNETGRTYVGWSWRGGSTATNEVYNATSGFSIVKWTGDDDSMSGDAQRVSHNLGVAPELILAKNRWNNGGPDNYNWQVYHKDVGASKYLILNNSNAEASYETENSIVPYSNTAVDFRDDMGMSDTIYMNQGEAMGSAETYVAYLFASVEGYSKVGSYEGNGLADGPFVYCGFKPAFIMIKNYDSTGYWAMFDTARSPRNSASTSMLYADLANAQDDYETYMAFDILSNGFKFRHSISQYNGSGGHIFYAVAESPFKYANAR